LSLHPLIARAGAGELPRWSVASPARVRHMERVSKLLGEWAGALRLSDEEQLRWRAAGILHDSLRGEDARALRGRLPPTLAGLHPDVVHGPAMAEHLRDEGVTDEGLLRAVSFHSIGHPKFDRLGRYLYAADFLEPGRKRRARECADLRRGMPDETAKVLVEVAKVRIGYLLYHSLPIRPETCKFWNVVVRESHE